MKIRIAAGVLGLVILLVAGVAALRRPEGAAATAIAVSRADLSVPILSDGTLEPPAGGELRAPDRATVAAIPATEGQRVVRGAALVVLENPKLSTSARDARSLVSELESDRVAAEGDLATARSDAERLRKVVESDGRLLAEGAITRAAADADAAASAAADRRERAARVKLESLTGSRIALADASSRELSGRAEALTVRAPADGVVYNLPRRIGESVEEGQLVANVADPARLRLRVRVDQPDLPRLASGQRLVVTFDGLPDKEWAGRVVQVSPGLREVGGRLVAEVLGEIADPMAQLPPNASVNVRIVVAEKKGALVVPRAALQRDGERRFVWTLSNGRARRRDVTIGLLAPDEVEIASGVSEGEKVLLPGMTPLTDGARVAAR